MELALRNKLMYATLHDYKTWWSTELVSAWDLEAAWNKIPLLYILMHPESPVTQVHMNMGMDAPMGGHVPMGVQAQTHSMASMRMRSTWPRYCPRVLRRRASSGCSGWTSVMIADC